MSDGTDTVRWRFRLATCCLVLFAITLIQSPGRIVADTKIDLVINPGGFLQRALDLWDPQGSFGQVQNQAYGYFFPMGPFFWLGKLAGLEPWVVQRLWWALLLCIAFLGMVRLAKELGVASPSVRLVAGFAFALSPRILSVIGPSSIEVWPTALAPWVLLPLVIGTRRGNPIRMAALSALAVMAVGGVNAAATFAVIPLGALWLLMAEPGPRRRRLMIWWPVFVLMGTLWWLIPLFLLGAYSPPFLDFIESASITTIAGTVFDALRGTSNWVPYVSPDSVAGRDLLSEPLLIVNGVVVMALGLVGLARRGAPHQRFLFAGLVLGLLLVTAGHAGALSGWGSTSIQTALDGILAPLRNTHKFDVVIRIPLVLGFAHLLSSLAQRAHARGDKGSDEAIRTLGISVLAFAALVGATAPGWTGNLANRGSFEGIPDYWQQSSNWLDDRAEGRAFLVPASAFPDYLWGSTGDEPLQPLSETNWAVRNSIPLANSGTIRLLDAVTSELAQGEASPGLSTTLRRAGIEYLVLRNDLDDTKLAANEESVHRTLSETDGISPVRSFGPVVGADPEGLGADLRTFVDGGWHAKRRAIEIFRVSRTDNARTQAVSDTATVVGSAASLVPLDGLGLTGGRSVLLAADQPRNMAPSRLILTDEHRRQEAAFGSVYDNRSASLAVADRYSARRAVHDYVAAGESRWLAVPRLIGATSLEASSSRATATTLGGARPGEQPFAAFDGDDRTSWVADGPEGRIRLEFTVDRVLGDVTIRADLAPGVTQAVTVATDHGPESITLTGTTPRTVDVGSVRELSIRGKARAGDDFSLAEISAPTLTVSRPLVLPGLLQGWRSPDVIALGVDESQRPDCLMVESIDRCRAGFGSWGEDGAVIDREFTLPRPATYAAAIAVESIGGAALDRFLQAGSDGQISASSAINRDPRSSVTRAVDKDPDTGWIARAGDTDPTVTLRWKSPQKIDQLSLTTAVSLPASSPTSAVLEFDGDTRQKVDIVRGKASFREVETERVDIHLRTDEPTRNYDSAGLSEPLPIGVSELRMRGGGLEFGTTDEAVTLPCGEGPELTVDGRRQATSVTTSRSDLAAGKPASATVCGPAEFALDAGRVGVRLAASSMFRPVSLVFDQDGGPADGAAASIMRVDGSNVARSLTVPFGPEQIVGTTENFNPGWTASGATGGLAPVQVNGWQQGWIVPPQSSGRIELTFAPNRAYRAGLVIGAVSALFLLVLVLRRWPAFAKVTVTRARRHPWISGTLAAALTVVAVGAVGGTLLVAAVVGGAAVGLLTRRLREREWLLIPPLAAGAMFYVIHPWGGAGEWAGNDRLPQLCVGLALGMVASATFSARHDLSLRNGSSTTR